MADVIKMSGCLFLLVLEDGVEGSSPGRGRNSLAHGATAGWNTKSNVKQDKAKRKGAAARREAVWNTRRIRLEQEDGQLGKPGALVEGAC